MPDSICRIGIRQPIFFCRIGIRQPRHFHYRLLFGNKIHRERWVDQEVNLPEERRPRRSLETRVFRYRLHLGKEINRKRWVDEDVNHPVFLVDQEVNLPNPQDLSTSKTSRPLALKTSRKNLPFLLDNLFVLSKRELR
ncbi:MAG TPA: hypothetical protein PLJ85_03560 [Candidatus Cloacimonas sp.]|nr:hypothetical protein [Candidatus Cloacimonas sp.]